MHFKGDRPERESIYMRNRSTKKGAFTLIELLVVVLILAILTAVALPLYLSSVKDSEKKTCQTNMQTIANAVQAYKVRTRVASYPDIQDVSTECSSSGKLSDLNFAPVCPEAGQHYTVTSLSDGFKVSCSDAAHGYWQNGGIVQP